MLLFPLGEPVVGVQFGTVLFFCAVAAYETLRAVRRNVSSTGPIHRETTRGGYVCTRLLLRVRFLAFVCGGTLVRSHVPL